MMVLASTARADSFRVALLRSPALARPARIWGAWLAAGLLLLVCAAAALAQPPTVGARPASGVVDDAAVLNATVNPQGVDTTYFFEYTIDAAYQSTPGSYQSLLAGGDAGAGSSASDVSAQLTGLQPSTTYHFRVDASNGATTVQGPDQTFTTDAAAKPPGVTSAQADTITDSAAAVSGTINPGGHATSYHLEYGPDPATGLICRSLPKASVRARRPRTCRRRSPT